MSTPSNLYAEKVYAEHPIALWALDDSQTYLSFIPDSERDITTWDYPGFTATSYTSDFPYPPFSDSPTTQITFSGPAATMKLTGNTTFNPSGTDTFTIGFYLYSFSTAISEVRVGYLNPTTSTGLSQPVSLRTESNGVDNMVADRFWHFVSYTFDSVDENIVISIEADYDAVSGDNSLIINGVTAGSYAEEFNGSSLGVQVGTIPSTLYTASAFPKGNIAYSYGSDENVGYYLSSTKKVYSRNSSTPMVYGSSSSTVLSPTNNMCLIVPGMGFLNDSGKHRELSFESWIRVIGYTSTAKRIIGPVASTDGLYVDGSSLVLKIGDNYGSHYVGEWDRPMLVNINVQADGANLMVNGDVVISLSFTTLDIDFPDKIISTKNADWIAFYSYSDAVLHVDCIAIYPYLVDSVLAKRKFVYAQGVEFPEQLNKAYFGDSFVTDYAYSQFGNNYNYPDSAMWKDGVMESFSDIDSTLSAAQYDLPEISLVDETSEEFLLSQYSSGKTYLEFGASNGYLLFDKESYFNSTTRGVYGIFSKTAGSGQPTDQTLIKIQNKINGNYLKARFTGGQVQYVFKYGTNDEYAIEESSAISDGDDFVAGFDLEVLSTIGNYDLSAFLSSPQNLRVYVGNTEDFEETFYGKIYTIGFVSYKGWDKVSQYFTNVGFISSLLDSASATGMYSINTTYNAKFKTLLGIEKMFVDVYSSGYWYDVVPLKLLAKTVTGETEGTTDYTVDYLQINADIPIAQELNGEYVTDDAPLRMYAHFQPLNIQGLTPDMVDVVAPSNSVIIPSVDWETERYEVVNGSIITIPTSINIEENALVITIESNINGVFYKPAFIRYLQIAGRALNKSGENFLSSRNGKRIFPYEVVGGTTKYNTISPVVIGKQSMPYFYSTGLSGIAIAGSYDADVDRGFEIRLNESLAPFFKMASLQTYVKYTKATFPTTAEILLSLKGLGDNVIDIKIQSVNNDDTRGRIFATQTVGLETLPFMDIVFYWNGSLVKEPHLNIKEWGVLGVSLLSPLSLDGESGSIKFRGTALFDNISYYQAPPVELLQQVVYRIWNEVSAETWLTWKDYFTWSEALITTAQPTVFGVSPELVYKSFTGTNRIIANSDVSDTTMLLNNYQYKIFNTYSEDIQFLTAR